MEIHNEIRRRPSGVNIPRDERIASAAIGAGVALLGLRARSPLGLLIGAGGAYLLARGVTGHCPVYRTIAIGDGVEVRRSITTLRPRAEVYRLWRRLDNLPRFLQHVRRVEVIDDRHSRWLVEEGPLTLEWTAEIVEDVPDRRLVWRSLPGSQIENTGMVELRDAPAGRGTEIHVAIRYRPPGGAIVSAPLRGLLSRYTRHQLGAELMRLRQLLETGELATGAYHHELGEPIQTALPVGV